MLQVDRVIAITPQIFSLCFKGVPAHKLSLVSKQLKTMFVDLEEIVCTFDRISLFFTHPQTVAKISSKMEGFTFLFSDEEAAVIWELPICFDSVFAEDLSTYFNWDSEKVTQYRESFLSLSYRLVFYGFLPGFAYFSGLPKLLHLNRKAVPSSAIAQGSVAVGGEQLGIYPQSSPGGWQIIGHCPVPLINYTQSPNIFMSPGDTVRFRAIDDKELNTIVDQIKNKVYQPKQLPNDHR